MTAENIVSAPVDISLEDAKRLLHQHRIEKLVLVDEHNILKGLITVKDIQKRATFQMPLRTPGTAGRGAAVGVGRDLEHRVELMTANGLES